MRRAAKISDHHRLALVMSAQNRLRGKAMDLAYEEILGEPAPAVDELAHADRAARTSLARMWDAKRPEIRAAIADGGSWQTIADRLAPQPVDAQELSSVAPALAETRLNSA